MIPDSEVTLPASVTPRVPSVQMRRALSIFLTLFFAIGPLTALFGDTDDTRLPACCRRHGAHHCAMSETAMGKVLLAGSQPAVTAPAHCPLYPQGTPATSSATQALTPAPGLRDAIVVAPLRTAPPLVAPANYLVRSLSVRGPPALSFA